MNWLRRLFSRRTRRPSAPRPRAPRARAAASPPARAGAGASAGAIPQAAPSFVIPTERFAAPSVVEQAMLARIERRVGAADLPLPNLPTTALRVIEMANVPSVELHDIERTISSDPVLSSELLKTANSALFAPKTRIDRIATAVSMLGLRRLRSLILAFAMRDTILGPGRLPKLASEVWWQSYMAARIARAIAPHFGFDRDRAFLLGLLHDLGRVPLLGLLHEELGKDAKPSESFVGRVFLSYHEPAGQALARSWGLDDELCAVAGCHHRFADNEHYARSAAFASLTHRLSLLLRTEGDGDHDHEYLLPELEFLELAEEHVFAVLQGARSVFAELDVEPAGTA